MTDFSSDDLLTMDDLALVLRRSRGSIRNDRSRNPGSLPPARKLPGTKTVLWRWGDVQAWLAGLPTDPAPRGGQK